MNVQELAGMKVAVAVEAMAQNGGGQLSLPGLSSISAGYSKLDTDGRTNNLYTREGWNAGAAVTTEVGFRPTVFATDGDLKYLGASLDMKLRHSGISFTSKNPDCILYVLVDVLGTNRSKNDNLLFWKDNLRATCELTYYAAEPKTGNLFFTARRSSAESIYSEKGMLFCNDYKTSRSLEPISPTLLPIDGNYAGTIRLATAMIASAEANSVAEANEPQSPQQSQFAKMRKRLEQKLNETNSYVQSGNLEAAEKTINDIRSIDPEYPGLDSVNSRFEAAKAQDSNSVK
jgi:soluble cytochrome b562